MARADELRWMSHSPDLLTAWHGPNWPARRYLVVEAVPGGGWDWVAWANAPGADAPGKSAVSGAAKTRDGAMHEAKCAMARLSEEAPL